MLFDVVVTVEISEFSFTQYHLIKADSHEEADKTLDKYCKNMYAGEAYKNGNCCYEFGCGYPIVTGYIQGQITKEKWSERVFARQLLVDIK